MNKLIWIAYLICGTTYAQVMVDAPVILEGEVPEDKQFLGLPFSEAPNDVLVTGTEQAGAFRGTPFLANAFRKSLSEHPFSLTLICSRIAGYDAERPSIRINAKTDLGPQVLCSALACSSVILPLA